MTYAEYIENIINSRGQWGILETTYFEMHHIKPKCWGGEGDYKNGTFKRYSHHPNCIWLYPQEHFTAYKLLAEEFPNDLYIVNAYWLLTYKCGDDPITYTELKTKYSAMIAERNQNFVWTDELRQQLSEKKKGHKLTVETIEKIKATKLTKNLNKRSDETKEKIRQSHLALNFHHSEETKQKIREAATGRVAINRKKIIYLDTGEIFNSITEATKIYGMAIKDCLRRKTATAYGLHWTYYSEEE